MAQGPSLKALQAFRVAGETQSFKQAAERLFVSQAAISQQIKTLEAYLGVRLFHRRTREVALTPEGQQLYLAVQQGFDQIDRGVRVLMSDSHPSRLNISTTPSFASRWLVPRLGTLQALSPELTINVSLSQSLVTFDDSSVDVAIRFGTGQYPELESVKLFDEVLVPVCHPSLLNRSASVSAQVSAMPLLMDEAPDMLTAWARLSDAAGLNLDPASSKFTVTDANMLVEAVLAGQGLSLLPFGLIHPLIERQQLVCPLPVWVKSTFDYYLVAPAASFKRQKVKMLNSFLQTAFEETQARWNAFERDVAGRSRG
ncbi:LysR substrate-binding domain-containing protein [Reinekea blandensis]|uniref:Glycine cleavage system transcription activator n=1 Tax=Reinekea blandensis MED297 TaxID=314283 RepID=A4BCT6_9GAMM|nr:LysR substrate-binding domain-containing protein [Reinekea blandensis]EAR10018.1 Glycine cleavage system transcription activator [Reinekea sp. MED297] [Reinekea blandensis MED297]